MSYVSIRIKNKNKMQVFVKVELTWQYLAVQGHGRWTCANIQTWQQNLWTWQEGHFEDALAELYHTAGGCKEIHINNLQCISLLNPALVPWLYKGSHKGQQNKPSFLRWRAQQGHPQHGESEQGLPHVQYGPHSGNQCQKRPEA